MSQTNSQSSKSIPLLIFIAWMASNSAIGVTLPEILKLAIENSVELKVGDADNQKAKAEVGSIDSAFDSTVYGSYTKSNDESMSPRNCGGDKCETSQSEVGYRKFFPTGTALDSSLSLTGSDTTYSAEQAAARAAAAAGSTSSSFNPNYSTELSVSVKQSLWRNFMAKEVSLAKESAGSKVVTTDMTNMITRQSVQSKAEALYWNLLALNANISNMKLLVAKTKTFATLMEKRSKLGRADDVDVATAEANVVEREGSLLNLEISRDQVAWQLAFAIGSRSIESLVSLSSKPLESNANSQLPANQTDAYNLAVQNRYDLKMRNQLAEALASSEKLADEKGKATVDVFAKYSSNGFDQKQSEANSETLKFDQPILSYGVEFSVSLGNTTSHMERKASVASRLSLEQQNELTKLEIKRDLALAFAKLQGAERQIKQAARQKSSLKRKEREEQRKLKQARTDRVGVLRYQMEVLAAESGRIDALKTRHDAAREIKTISHAY